MCVCVCVDVLITNQAPVPARTSRGRPWRPSVPHAACGWGGELELLMGLRAPPAAYRPTPPPPPPPRYPLSPVTILTGPGPSARAMHSLAINCKK